MPFDALVALERTRTLSETLNEQRVTVVNWEELVAHKQAQQKRFGPSFWYRHQALVSVALIVGSPVIGAAAAAVHGFAPQWNALSIACSFAWLCLAALLTGTGLIRVRAGSYWRETRIPAGTLDHLGVPQPVARIARELHGDLAGSKLILGELMREQAVLDPYLLLKYGNECICLGIWEGERVIASASVLRSAE